MNLGELIEKAERVLEQRKDLSNLQEYKKQKKLLEQLKQTDLTRELSPKDEKEAKKCWKQLLE